MAISAGVYTVGPNRDYADWYAAVIDLAASLTGDLYLLQLGELEQTTGANFAIDLNGHNLILSCPFPHKGHPSSGMKSVFNHSGEGINFQMTDGVGGGAVVVSHLYLERKIGSGASGTDALLRVHPSGTSGVRHHLHDLLLDGNDENNIGLRVSTEKRIYVWNIKAQRFLGAAGAGFASEDNASHQSEMRVENCTVCNSYHGFRTEILVSTGKYINCVAFYNTSDFTIYIDQLGSGNISEDGTAADFIGTNNLYSYDGVINSPAVQTEFKSLALSSWWLRINDEATVLPFGGVASEIDDSASALRWAPKANKTGAEGNGRPGSDGAYSRGADEYRETFPNAWTRRARILVDPQWVDGNVDPPIFVREDTPGLPDNFRTLTKAYGDDIRITSDPEGQELLPCEVFRHGPDDDDFSLWFGDLAPNEETTTPVYVWWGNPNASQPPDRGSNPDGIYRLWAGAGLVLHMGNELDDLTWCKDSSGYHRHPWITGLTAWHYSSITHGKRAAVNGSARFNAQAVAGVLKSAVGGAATAVVTSSATPGTDSIVQAVRSGLERLHVKLDERLLSMKMSAPDSSPQSLVGDVNLGTAVHIVSAVANVIGDRMFLYVDRVLDEDEVKAFTPSSTDNTDLDTLTVAQEISGSDGFRGYLEEVRLWNKYLQEAWVKIVHQNLGWSKTLFTGYSGGACMNGVRNFTFTVPGSGPFKLDNTDFWLSYEDDGAGGLTLRLNGIWDKICPATEIGLARRVELEAVVRELSEWFAGLRGTLLIDENLNSEFTLEGAKLLIIDWEVIDNNAGLLYTLEFGLNLGIAGTQFSRMLVFGSKALAADNLIVTVAGRDQTQFKTVFRAAPVRIPGGPPIKRVQVAAIVQGLGPGGVAQRRRQAEAIIRNWVDAYLGQEAQLTIDGQGYGTAHLLAVRSGTVELPEAAGFDLEFAIEYGS